MIDVDDLSKLVDASQLTADLDGTFSYDHNQWIDLRIVSPTHTRTVYKLRF